MLFEDNRLERRDLVNGEVVYSQGLRPEAAYVVLSGRVGLSKRVGDRTVPLGALHPGAVFGASEVLSGDLRIASAIALEPTALIVLPAEIVKEKTARSDAFIQAYLSTLSESLSKIRETHMLRPRSLRDSLLMIADESVQMRRFVERNDTVIDGPQLLAALNLLDAAVAELQPLVARQHDRRHDVIIPGTVIRYMS